MGALLLCAQPAEAADIGSAAQEAVPVEKEDSSFTEEVKEETPGTELITEPESMEEQEYPETAERRNLLSVYPWTNQSFMEKVTGRKKSLFSEPMHLAEEYAYVRRHREFYPDDTAVNAAGNPNLIHFLYQYIMRDYKLQSSIRLTEAELKQKVPVLYQWDERWGFSDYGRAVIGITGCGPTSLSMVITGMTRNPKATPREIATFAAENNYYVAGDGTRWALFPAAAREYGLHCSQIPVSEKNILEELEAGRLLICSMGPGIFTAQGHFIVVAGQKDGKFIIHDPNNRANTGKLWTYDEIRKEIRAVFSFRK